jgi:hypothetical protein
MKSVITFWQLPADEEDFLVFLQGTGTILGLPDRWVEGKAELTPQPIVPFIEKHNPDQLLFGLEEQLLDLRIAEHTVADGIRFALLPMEPCAITYRRSRMRKGKLGLSNLSAYWDYPCSDTLKLMPKDQRFVKWGRRVLAWIREFTPKQIKCNGYAYRATQRVEKAISEGELEVALY